MLCLRAFTRDTSLTTVMCRERVLVTVVRLRLMRCSRAALNCCADWRRLALMAPPEYRGISTRSSQRSPSVPIERRSSVNSVSGSMVRAAVRFRVGVAVVAADGKGVLQRVGLGILPGRFLAVFRGFQTEIVLQGKIHPGRPVVGLRRVDVEVFLENVQVAVLLAR